MIMLQCGLTDQWPSYPPGLHIRCTTSIKFMPNRIAPRLPPLDLWKKKGKVLPHSKVTPNQGSKDKVALCPIPYDWSRHFTKDAATKSVVLKLGIEFDQNDTMLFYYKDMYENSHLSSTSDYDKEENSNHMHMVQILHPTKTYRFND